MSKKHKKKSRIKFALQIVIATGAVIQAIADLIRALR